MHRRLPYVCALALLLCAGLGRSAAASPPHAYISTPYFYALTYPASWRRMRVPGADLAIIAPNRNDVVSVSVAPGSADGAVLRRALPRAFVAFGHLLRPPSPAVLHFRGATGWAARGLVRTPRGRESSVLVVLVSHHGHLLDILAVVADRDAPGAASDERAVTRIVATLRFL